MRDHAPKPPSGLEPECGGILTRQDAEVCHFLRLGDEPNQMVQMLPAETGFVVDANYGVYAAFGFDAQRGERVIPIALDHLPVTPGFHDLPLTYQVYLKQRGAVIWIKYAVPTSAVRFQVGKDSGPANSLPSTTIARTITLPVAGSYWQGALGW